MAEVNTNLPYAQLRYSTSVKTIDLLDTTVVEPRKKLLNNVLNHALLDDRDQVETETVLCCHYSCYHMLFSLKALRTPLAHATA